MDEWALKPRIPLLPNIEQTPLRRDGSGVREDKNFVRISRQDVESQIRTSKKL